MASPLYGILCPKKGTSSDPAMIVICQVPHDQPARTVCSGKAERSIKQAKPDKTPEQPLPRMLPHFLPQRPKVAPDGHDQQQKRHHK